MKEQSLFDHLKNLTIRKTPWEDDDNFTKNYNQYMINKFISMDDRFLPLVDELNKIKHLPDKTHYEFLFNYLPKANIFFNYIKKNKDNSEIINIIADYYRVPKQEAEEMLHILPDNIIKELKELYEE